MCYIGGNAVKIHAVARVIMIFKYYYFSLPNKYITDRLKDNWN